MKDQTKETDKGQPFHFKITHTVTEDGIVIETMYRPADLYFRREKDLIKFIAQNQETFAKEVLKDDIPDGQGGRYTIKFCNPAKPEEVRAAIGQLLNLGREDEEVLKGNEEITQKKCKLLLISTLFDIETARTIKHFNLPIRYIHFAREGDNEKG